MVCLDTTFLIDVIKGKTQVDALEDDLNRGEIYVASPSLIELFKGIYLKRNLKHVTEDEVNQIKGIVSSFNILDLDAESAILAGNIEADLMNQGQLIDLEDIMIAAIAMYHNEILVTRNLKHFQRVKGLKIQGY